MSSDPAATIGGSGIGGDDIMKYLQMAKGATDIYSGLRRGNISQGLGGALNLYGGYQGMQGKPKPNPSNAPSSESPTTQSKFGMNRDEFMRLDPELRQRMLQQLMGR